MYQIIQILGAFICLHVIPNLCDLLSSMTHKLILFNNVLAAFSHTKKKLKYWVNRNLSFFTKIFQNKHGVETHKKQWCLPSNVKDELFL